MRHRNVILEVVEQFATYEDYLDAQVTETDMYFLEVRTQAYVYYVVRRRRVSSADGAGLCCCRMRTWLVSWWSWGTVGVATR